jgi:prepilin-type N-terminal cleavage/methylation domain-containing protein
MLRREEGFTLIELIVVMLIMAVLLSIAVGFYIGARDKAADATARANLRIALPAVEAYRSDAGTYAGMTLAVLQASYSPGVQGITVVSADATGYCLSASAGGATWYKTAAGQITTTACS